VSQRPARRKPVKLKQDWSEYRPRQIDEYEEEMHGQKVKVRVFSPAGEQVQQVVGRTYGHDVAARVSDTVGGVHFAGGTYQAIRHPGADGHDPKGQGDE
jgi:hypothetical protein